MFLYALKRVLRGYRLFLALTIGVLIATTFFASMIVSADVLSKDAVTNALKDIDYDARIQANNVTWTGSQFAELQATLESQPEVTRADRYAKISYQYNASAKQTFDIVGMRPNTTAWSTLTHINGTANLGINETYVVAGSVNASYLSTGQVLNVPVRALTTSFPYFKTIYVNLTVAGFVDIPPRTAQLLNPPRYFRLGFIQIPIGDWRKYDILLVDWDLTIGPLVDWFSGQQNVTQLAMECGFYCQLNRNMLVNPYDIGGSSASVSNAMAKILDRTSSYNTVEGANLLGATLSTLSLQASFLILSFVALAAPVIFMSWYSSTMLSDVSYNLRRREFGLLQTKGYGPKAIKRMLLFEGAIIGLIGGFVGLITGTFVAYLLVGAGLESLPAILLGNTMNIIVVMAFAVIMAVWSVRGPADRAARLDPLDSLKQYVYVEEQREYKKLLPTIALFLGTYKLIVWLLGINMSTVLSSALSTNFIVLIAVALWTPVDGLLNFVGPIAFLYGATRILLRGSQKFQEAVVNVGSRFFGAFGHLATRNVTRHPARNAALVFVVSLIVSYGLSSVGNVFTEQDTLERTSLYEVGSDVSATFNPGTNMSLVSQTVSVIPEVNESTIEYRITMSSTRGGLEVRGIAPENWSRAAFYETAWFTGASIDGILSNFTGEKIILSISVARQLQLQVGNSIALRGPGQSTVHRLAIVGLVGYASPFEDILGQFAFGGTYPSYVPAGFLNNASLVDISNGWILIKVNPGANGTVVEQEISLALPQAASTDSLTSRLKDAQTNSYQVGGTRARWLGIIFAGVLAVVGTGLVVGLTLKEKEQETTLLSVRGLSRGEILKALTAEVMVMVLFSLILGVATGFIQLFGNIANTSQSTQELVRPRMVFTPLSILAMTGIVLIVVIAALIPVLMTSRVTEERINSIRE